MSQAACEVKENMTNPTDIVDTRVAIDGTWQKRGKEKGNETLRSKRLEGSQTKPRILNSGSDQETGFLESQQHSNEMLIHEYQRLLRSLSDPALHPVSCIVCPTGHEIAVACGGTENTICKECKNNRKAMAKEKVQDATDYATRLFVFSKTSICCQSDELFIEQVISYKMERHNQLQDRVIDMEHGRRRSHAENTDVGIVSYYVGIQFGILLN
eukprot:gene10490-11590_t